MDTKLEGKILDALKDKVRFYHTDEIKRACVREALKECGVSLSSGQEADRLCDQIFSLGPVDSLLEDSEVEDIIINHTQPMYCHKRGSHLVKTEYVFPDMESLELLIQKIMVFGEQDGIGEMADINLPDLRGRVNIVYSPLGPELTITKIRKQPLSIIHLLDNESLSSEMAALLWLYIEGKGVRQANIVLAGAAGAGKTTLLNALLSFLVPDKHTVVIEDTMELMTDWIGDVSRLQSNERAPLSQLVRNSLRMREDYLVVGEVRGEEAKDMVTAMNVGVKCMCTLHAGNAREAILRLQSHPMNVPQALINLIDVFVVLGKKQKDGAYKRVVEEITETSHIDSGKLLIGPIWRFDNGRSEFEKVSPSTVYRDRLSQMGGWSPQIIMEEIQSRKAFLEQLQQSRVLDIAAVSQACQGYIARQRAPVDPAVV